MKATMMENLLREKIEDECLFNEVFIFSTRKKRDAKARNVIRKFGESIMRETFALKLEDCMDTGSEHFKEVGQPLFDELRSYADELNSYYVERDIDTTIEGDIDTTVTMGELASLIEYYRNHVRVGGEEIALCLLRIFLLPYSDKCKANNSFEKVMSMSVREPMETAYYDCPDLECRICRTDDALDDILIPNLNSDCPAHEIYWEKNAHDGFIV